VVTTHHGTEIKTTGDGLMLCFGSAAQAVACGVALQQAAEQQGRQARRPAATSYSVSSSSSGVVGAGVPACPPVQIRVGVSSGEATRENGDLYGPPVVEASRLCAAAAPGLPAEAAKLQRLHERLSRADT